MKIPWKASATEFFYVELQNQSKVYPMFSRKFYAALRVAFSVENLKANASDNCNL